MNMCPVCAYNGLRRPADDDIICPSCGTQFGYTDARTSHAELRKRWLDRGAHWYSRVTPQPHEWNAYTQLIDAGLIKLEIAGIEAESNIAMIDLGTETIPLSVSGTFSEMKTRLVALGRTVPFMLSAIHPSHA